MLEIQNTKNMTGIIFAGHKAFESIKSHFGVEHDLNQIIYGDIRFIKHSAMEPTALVTLDPDLVQVLKDFEQKQ